jgi:preprotein translocase subunit YajC
MSGAVIGLVSLILLLVIGAVIYFSMQEEKKEPVYVAPVVVPVVAAASADEEEEEDTFDIVNGWIYDNAYNHEIGLANDGISFTYTNYNEESPTTASKWSFETDDEFYQISSGTGKYIKITSQDVQLTSSSSSTSRINIVAVDDGYKFSDRKGKYWMQMNGANLLSVDAESDASVFSIDASQYYIKGYETEKETFTSEDLISSMSNQAINCKTGVLSGFTFKDTANKGKYDYTCTEGESASGDLGDKILTEAGVLLKVQHLGKNAPSFDIACENGALANFRIIPAVDGKASYEYSCRDIATFGDDVTITKQMTTGNQGEIHDLKRLHNNINCGEGEALTSLKYTLGGGGDNETNVILSGICKKLAA